MLIDCAEASKSAASTDLRDSDKDEEGFPTMSDIEEDEGEADEGLPNVSDPEEANIIDYPSADDIAVHTVSSDHMPAPAHEPRRTKWQKL